MGRSKWLLILLLPMLFGFDTRNPFRTRGPIKIADFTVGGGGSGELYDAPTQNINTSYNPLCNPATFSAAGGLFCDGFEDGQAARAFPYPDNSTDGWWVGSSGGHPDAPCSPAGSPGCADPEGNDWANFNDNVTDTAKADFGAAGTPGSMTHGWTKDVELVHCLKVDGSGDQVECATNHALDVQDIRLAFYYKLAGVSSTRCPAGYPNCSAYSYGGIAGVKGMEFRDGLDTGGITYVNWSLEGSNNSRWMVGIGDPNTCIPGSGQSNASAECTSGSTGPGAYCYPNVGTFDWRNFKDRWVFVELHIKQTAVVGTSVVEMWMNDCGADGLGCTTTPTKITDADNLTMLLNGGGGCSLPDAVYFNFDHNSGITGEVQIDEVIVMDGSIRTTPIGFTPIRD